MGNPFITIQEIIDRDIKLSWYWRKLFGMKPKDFVEDLWRNGGWQIKKSYPHVR